VVRLAQAELQAQTAPVAQVEPMAQVAQVAQVAQTVQVDQAETAEQVEQLDLAVLAPSAVVRQIIWRCLLMKQRLQQVQYIKITMFLLHHIRYMLQVA
jgi:hypothetical protein